MPTLPVFHNATERGEICPAGGRLDLLAAGQNNSEDSNLPRNHEKMKIYTKTGDSGETGLVGGRRVWKNSPRLEVCGAYDELNALLGLVRSERGVPEEVDQLLEQFQNDLFNAGSEMATVPPAVPQCPVLGPEQIERIEMAIDRFEAALPPLSSFILPGGCRAAALLHLARTVCRRAERQLVAVQQLEAESVNTAQLVYLNRLGDLLFVLARAVNQQSGIPDTPWRKIFTHKTSTRDA
jgi:cob(I)alamin adenosyltransferase